MTSAHRRFDDLDVPDVVRSKARAANAEHWLTDLPALVAEIEDRWSITVGVPYSDPTEAYVAEATLADGTPAVLKLIVPRDGDVARHEIAVLRAANGNGCAQLLRHDETNGALLLERLGPSLHELALPLPRRQEILCAAAIRMWRPAADLGLPNGAEKGRWLIDAITSMWDELGHPCSQQAVEHAIECAQRRIAAHDDERSVLVHGDIHEWNALQSTAAGSIDAFKLVDPDGLIAEAEYDMGILMREDPVELRAGDPRDRSRRLATQTGLDAAAIWEWGVVERVSTGLLATKIGLQPVGREMLQTADWIVRSASA